MATPSNDIEEKIKQTLIRLAEGPGYHPRKLLSASILELFPQHWSQLMQVAACDELIRELEPRVGRANHAAALRAALDVNREYDIATLQARLVAFRTRWHDEHTDSPPEVDLTDPKKTWDATRKWWESGRDQLAHSLSSEIKRRERIGWPEPGPESVERIEVALLPDAQPTDQVAAEIPRPQSTIPRDHRRRAMSRSLLVAIALILVLGISGVIWFSNKGDQRAAAGPATQTGNTLAATCADVGDGSRGVPDPMWSGPFRAAYQTAGGKAELGCPRTDDPSGYVHQWGAGTSQDLQGGRAGIARIMAIDPEHVIVMAGTYWQDYTDLGSGLPNSNAAQEEGYPTSNPFACGPARLVLLADSQHNETPGAMVTAAQGGHFVWLPKPIWLAYKAVGGPFGPLGRPVGNEQLIASGIRQSFEHGSISLIGDTVSSVDQYGHAEPLNLKASSTLQNCINSH